MNKTLRHDTETGELRLVYADLWQGQHERTEYRVIDQPCGDGVRRRPDLDGTPVLGTAPDLYFEQGPFKAKIWVWTDQRAVGPTVKTPCARSGRSRRKCSLCDTA